MSDNSQAGPIPSIEEFLAGMTSAATPADALGYAKDMAGLVVHHSGFDSLAAAG
jgi:hypothetical protein